MIKYEDLLDELNGAKKYLSWHKQTQIKDTTENKNDREFLYFADDELRHLNFNLRKVDKEIQQHFISTHAKEMLTLSIDITDEMYKGW